jgi:glucose/arabinose dehydrogenase
MVPDRRPSGKFAAVAARRHRRGSRNRTPHCVLLRRGFSATVRGITTWRVFVALVFMGLDVGEAGEIGVPAGFRMEVFARNVGGARSLALDPRGVLVVSIPSKGRVVALPDREGSGRATHAVTILKDLDLPHGLAFARGYLYVAETGRIVRYRYHAPTLTAVDPTVVVRGLPTGAHHWTRSIVFGPDGKLYVAIGSSCDVCEERDPRRAAIVRYNADGSGEQLFATGLRNPVGLMFHPMTAALWTTVNERDWPGGGAPPDYVTEVRRGAAYGWPRCFAEGGVFVRDQTIAGPRGCEGMTPPTLQLMPHAAPLGLVFYTGAQFPSEYRDNLFVALHGSRAGLPAAGYKIARVRFRAGRAGDVEDFSTGWRHDDRVIGRPVDLVVGHDGSLYVSDDHADCVHRVTYSAGR